MLLFRTSVLLVVALALHLIKMFLQTEVKMSKNTSRKCQMSFV